MRRLTVLTLALVSAVVTVGCGTSAPVRITDRPEVQELAMGGLPKLNYSLTVSPAVLQQAPLQPQEGVHAATVSPGPGEIQDSLVTMLRDLEVFKDVKSVEGQPDSVRSAISLASSAQSDLILIPKVKQFNVVYEGRNGTHIPKVIVWSLFEWMSWFMADELYRVDMTCEFDFRDGANGNLLYSQVRSVSTRKPVSDYQRGIKIWGIVRMPGSLNEKNYRNVGTVVGPHAIQDMHVNFLRSVLPAFERFSRTPAFTSRFSRTAVLPERTTRVDPKETIDTQPKPPVKEPERNIAYIFGVDDYDELTISPLKHAAADAKAFKEQLLAKSTKPQFKPDDLHVLVNEWASFNAMKRALDDAVASSKKKLKTVVFYFAGRGALGKSSAGDPMFYLLPQDADITNLEGTALSLRRLASGLRPVNAEQVIVILDCGFDSAGKGRSAPTGVKFISSVKYPSALRTHAGYSILAAAGAGRAAYESGVLKSGLLTNALVRGAGSARVLGSDRALGMREAYDYAKTAVPVEARKLGFMQEPYLFGTAPLNVLYGKK